MNLDKAIVFDLGGVLIDWDPRYLFRKMFNDEADIEYFLKNVCTSEWNTRQDGGYPLAQATADKLAEFPEFDPYIRAFYGRWLEMIHGSHEGTVTIFRELKDAGYYIAALSNWSAETFPLVRNSYEFFSWFEEIVLSGEEKQLKPAPDIYHTLLKRINRQAEECVFIDDSYDNIVTARSLGFTGIHFQSPQQLRKDLEAAEIL